MKPLRVCFPYVGDTVGGSHISSIHLIKGLLRQNVEPIIVFHSNGPLAAYLESEGLSFEKAPDVRLVESGSIVYQLKTMAAAVLPLARYLRCHHIDIVHTNDARMHLTWGPAAKAANVPFIWHQRSADGSRRLAYYSRLANEVLTVSKFCKAEFPGVMGCRAKVVTNPFDTDHLALNRAQARSRLLKRLNLPKETRVVGYFANFTSRKRPETFVEVATRLKRRVVDLVCPMFGDPRNKGGVDELLTSSGAETLCPIMGFCTPILPWMAACDVMLAPAVAEPYGRTIIEAMLVGTPIVTSADGGNPEIITHGETGLLVEPDSISGFESAVMQLLRDPEGARAMADRARTHALQRYSVERHAQDLLAIYRDAAGLGHAS